MKKLPLWSLLWLVVFLAANAEQVVPGATSGIHVEVAKVVATGAVKPVDGITSAGQPDEAAFRVFADAGYVAVIDMRGPDEDRELNDEPAFVEALGMDYIAFPIVGKDAINFEVAKELDGLLEAFDGPVLVHCASGNRVGALLALRHSLGGASIDETLAYGKNAGMTRLEPVVRKLLGD